MKKWIAIAAFGLLAAWFFLPAPRRLPEEYRVYVTVMSDLRQIGQATEIYFSDHEGRENVYLKELPTLSLSRIDPDDIVQPIHRKENDDPDYPNVIHKEHGTMADIQRETAKFGLRE